MHSTVTHSVTQHTHHQHAGMRALHRHHHRTQPLFSAPTSQVRQVNSCTPRPPPAPPSPCRALPLPHTCFRRVTRLCVTYVCMRVFTEARGRPPPPTEQAFRGCGAQPWPDEQERFFLCKHATPLIVAGVLPIAAGARQAGVQLGRGAQTSFRLHLDHAGGRAAASRIGRCASEDRKGTRLRPAAAWRDALDAQLRRLCQLRVCVWGGVHARTATRLRHHALRQACRLEPDPGISTMHAAICPPA